MTSTTQNKYVFYTGELSLEPNTAHEIHDVLCANAAANLGFSSVLVYHNKNASIFNPNWFLNPFQPQQPNEKFVDFYNPEEHLKVLPLPMPYPIDRIQGKFTSSNTIATKYYLPFHLHRHTKIVHTRDWNFAKASVKNRIPVIFEKHHFQSTPFESEIVKSPYLQIVITQSEPVRQSLIQYGMPPEKVVWQYNGFEQSFLDRQPQEAETWRQQLLTDGRKILIVYSGALYTFKGIDLLIDVAAQLPHIQFAVTGGKESQVEAYQQIAKQKNVQNINFLGWVMPRKRLVSLFQAADLLAHPHLSGKEADFTNPVKFFQYMASGTPIVVTEILPLIPFKDSPLIATWCEPDNPQKFAQSILYALEKYPRKIEGYTDSINYARQFSWESRILKILNYVEEPMRPKIMN
ncbi:group 1 glycosyl transferase [Calothrix sp. NIES-4071]|nr:group 1 glycosyl transferase [Calothrix sp. NIES-4071]BAZ62494.1 group 1 glycosyl transferase [Calothrix sp. NIES-4105]